MQRGRSRARSLPERVWEHRTPLAAWVGAAPKEFVLDEVAVALSATESPDHGSREHPAFLSPAAAATEMPHAPAPLPALPRFQQKRKPQAWELREQQARY